MTSFDETGFSIFLTQDCSFITIIHCWVREFVQWHELKVAYTYLYLEPILTLTEPDTSTCVQIFIIRAKTQTLKTQYS